MAVGEVAVRLHETVRSGVGIGIVRLEPEPMCWRSFSGPGTRNSGSRAVHGKAAERDIVKPDLHAVLSVGVDELHWFIEVDRGTEHRPAIERKLAAYERYYRSGVEQSIGGVFPQVLWIAECGSPETSARRVAQLNQWIDGCKESTRELFVVRDMEHAITEMKGGES